jgi:hypothetical protein
VFCLAVQDMHICEVSLQYTHPNVTFQASIIITEKTRVRKLQAGKSSRLSKVRNSVQRLWLAHVGYCAATYCSSCFWDSCTSSRLTSSSVISGSNMSCPMLAQRLPKVLDAASYWARQLPAAKQRCQADGAEVMAAQVAIPDQGLCQADKRARWESVRAASDMTLSAVASRSWRVPINQSTAAELHTCTWAAPTTGAASPAAASPPTVKCRSPNAAVVSVSRDNGQQHPRRWGRHSRVGG